MANITAAMVKAIRERTGAGMMNCKEALEEAEGNEEKAVEIIEKKGLAKVAKKAGAIAAEGIVHAYIHAGSRIGVLIEVNCQTDFVARNDDFKTFADQVAMQIASMSPLYVRESEIPEADVAAQSAIFAGQMEEEARETGKSKPAEATAKILEGKIAKWKKENCLLEQVSIMVEDKKTIGDICDELSARIGEKISVRRFVRYELGEGIEKKKEDLAAAVAETLAAG
jgi:elongation factor Ts